MSEENPENRFPPNPIHPWLRVILWILPTGFTMFSALALAWLAKEFRIPHPVGIPLWVIANLGFMIYAGWCDFKLARNWVKTTYFEVTSVVMFCFLQIFIIPLSLFLIGSAGYFLIR